MIAEPVLAPPQDAVISACRAVLNHPKALNEGLAAWLQCSVDTVTRLRASDSERQWTRARIRALCKYEIAVLDTHTIQAAQDQEEMPAIVGRADRLLSDLSDGIAEDAELIRDENQILAAGSSADVQSIKKLIADLDQIIAHKMQERADSIARLAIAQGRGA